MGLIPITEKNFRKKLFINTEKRTKRKAWLLLKK